MSAQKSDHLVCGLCRRISACATGLASSSSCGRVGAAFAIGTGISTSTSTGRAIGTDTSTGTSTGTSTSCSSTSGSWREGLVGNDWTHNNCACGFEPSFDVGDGVADCCIVQEDECP